MNELIAKTFVILVLLAYTAVFLALILAVVRKWLRERPKPREPNKPGGRPDALHLHEGD